MTTLPVTIDIPEAIYHQLKVRAEQTQRSVEEEAIVALADAVAADVELAPELVAAMADVESLDDDALRTLADGTLAPEVSEELEHLHNRNNESGLSASESKRLNQLIDQYQRHMLQKAKASAILQARRSSSSDAV